MADDKNLDSNESVEDIVAPEESQFEVYEDEVPVEGGFVDGVDEPLVVSVDDEALEDGRTIVAEGEDQPGENLASELLPDEVAPYELAAEEIEAEELDESIPADADGIDDESQLAEAEAVAAAAVSTRPMKRKQKRALAETALEAADEPAAVATTTNLRPQKKSTLPEKKDHATPKRKTATARDEKKRVGPGQFVRESIEELRKVVWPTGAQLWQYFVVVLVFVLFIIAFVSLLDFGFGWLLLKLFG